MVGRFQLREGLGTSSQLCITKHGLIKGSIVEAYITDECLKFFSRYLKDDIDTSFNKAEINMCTKGKKDKKHKSTRDLGIFSRWGYSRCV